MRGGASGERRIAMKSFLTLLFFLFAQLTFAADSLEVRFSSGYPIPGVSLDSFGVSISRHADTSRNVDAPIDKLFAEVAKILSAAPFQSDSSVVFPDAPTVEILVQLENKTVRLVASTDGVRLVSPINPTPSERIHIKAMNQLIALTAKHSQSKFQPK